MRHDDESEVNRGVCTLCVGLSSHSSLVACLSGLRVGCLSSADYGWSKYGLLTSGNHAPCVPYVLDDSRCVETAVRVDVQGVDNQGCVFAKCLTRMIKMILGDRRMTDHADLLSARTSVTS